MVHHLKGYTALLIGLPLGALLFSCSPQDHIYEGTWVSKANKTKMTFEGNSFGLDDYDGKVIDRKAPVRGVWSEEGGSLILTVNHSECCKVPVGLVVRIRVTEWTKNSMTLVDEKENQSMFLERLAQ